MSTELRLTPGSEVMQFQEIESNAAIGHVNTTAILDIGEDAVHLRPYRCRACRHRFYASTRYFHRAA